MTKNARKLLDMLKDSNKRGAASMSCDNRLEAAEELVKLKLAEKYGFGYRITEKGMRA